MLSSTTPTLAVLASGEGSNFEALALAARSGALGGRIGALLSDHADCRAVARARSLGIEAVVLETGRFRTRIEDEKPWLEALRARGVEVLLLAGFMRLLHATLLEAYPDRILNIHPSLLPAFPGRDAIGQAWRHGARVTGCTVHLVDEAVDGGAIVAQSAVEVGEGESLESLTARIHAAEHALYPEAVRRFLLTPWRREGRRLKFGAAAEATRG